jgi:hypothetical protein
MAKKTWKIGEYCKGGIISVEVNKSEVILYLKDWDFSKGSNRSSDQSNAKVLETERFVSDGSSTDVCYEMVYVLCDWTTSYYADQIITWIKENIKE